MKKKILYLFLALALPGLVFVFLKRFGKNEFDIPRYFQSGVDSVNRACGTLYAAPYHIPDSVLVKSGWQEGKPGLFVLDSAVRKDADFLQVIENFKPSSVQLLDITKNGFTLATLQRWRTCVLMVKTPYNVVLVDADKVIRSYFALPSREETDRLAIELSILLKKY